MNSNELAQSKIEDEGRGDEFVRASGGGGG